jgi:hypothetical protein
MFSRNNVDFFDGNVTKNTVVCYAELLPRYYNELTQLIIFIIYKVIYRNPPFGVLVVLMNL